MGVMRKMTSAMTLGAVDYRSDKERIARSTRKTSKEAAKQTQLAQEQLRLQQEAMALQQQAAIQHQAMMQQQALLAQRGQQPAIAQVPLSVPERLQQLDALLAQRIITPAEHAARRLQILAEI